MLVSSHSLVSVRLVRAIRVFQLRESIRQGPPAIMGTFRLLSL